MGPHYYGLMHRTLLFPSYRTAQDYRKELLNEISISGDIFNGTKENISKILNRCRPGDSGSKAILAVDAAYVTPYVSVDSYGNVRGLIGVEKISRETASHLIENEDDFSNFILAHKEKLIGAEFVLMLIPTDDSHRAFPICNISARHGKATIEILAIIYEKCDYLEQAGIQVVGISTDGDSQYIKITTTFMNNIIANIEKRAQQTTSRIIREIGEKCHFSDPFHLVKRDRYRKVSKEHLIIDPWNESQQYSVHDLAELGIPDYILGAEQARKLEDLLPLKLFSQETLCLILERDDPGLFFAMLPSTLLLESIHSKALGRKQRIDYLMIGASLLILYELYKITVKELEADPEETGIKSIPNKLHGFTTEWSADYISLALSTVALLYSEETLNLGACGTHILEHYFGAIRRHSGGENTHDRFMKSMKKVFLEQHLLIQLNIPREHQQGRSDSGCIVRGAKITEKNRLIDYLQIARGLMQTFMNVPEE
jgi:hypothetical protein